MEIGLEDHQQDFLTLDLLRSGRLLGYSIMFRGGRLSLLGIGTTNGDQYYSLKEVQEMLKKRTMPKMRGLYVYLKTTGEADPLPWNATTLKYPITEIKRMFRPKRYGTYSSNE